MVKKEKGFPGGPVVKNPPVNVREARDTGLTPGLGRYAGRGNSNPLMGKKRTLRTHGQVQERPRVSALPILGGPQGELAGVQRGGDVPGRTLWSREPQRVWVSPRPAPPRWPFFSHPGTQAMGGSAALWQLLAGCLSRFWAVGEGEGGKIWENGIETCKISCMK